jgi:predicted nucleic acid-binding protein
LDASGLIKGYLAEAESTDVVRAIATASVRATSAIAYPELRAVFARVLRERRLDEVGHDALVDLLEAHWPRYAVVAVEEDRLREAGELTARHTRHALRALDAIHLASALFLAAGQPHTITFACWDVRLWRAAHDEGFTLLPAAEPG